MIYFKISKKKYKMRLVVKIKRAPIVGSNANNGVNAGFGYVNSNNAASNTNANISSQLSCKNFIDLQTMALAKKTRTLIAVLVAKANIIVTE